jgi:hypothetical protein
MGHHQTLLAPRAGRQGAGSSPDFRERPTPAGHDQSLPGVKRRESRPLFVTPTLHAPGVLTCWVTAWLDRRRSSATDYSLFA